MADEENGSSGGRLFGIRLAIGFAQGLALYLLYRAVDTHSWPSDNGLVFAPLLIVFLFAPLAALQGLGNLRTRTLLIWVGTLTLFLAGLAFYDIWHAWPVDWVTPFIAKNVTGIGTTYEPDLHGAGWQPHIMPSLKLFVALALGGFISHALISGGDTDRRFIASYATHFDVSWKLGLQFALSIAFVGAFWAFLFLGAALFQLIDLDFLLNLIKHEWFWIPATALAASSAIHITDVRAGLIRGTRTLALTLLSWLLPLLTIIIASFLIALVFTGFEPLWKTRSATAVLLASAAALIALINAVYQDGASEHAAPPSLRYPATFAAMLPAPLIVLAGYALELRVHQHGWTEERVFAAACVFIAACYAGGYAVATLRAGPWLKPIERWNFYTSLLALAVLLAVFSPIVDPMRISVGSQMANLESGKVAAEKFDFAALRWSGGRYGKQALEKLAGDASRDYMQKAAQAALEMKFRYDSTIPVDLDANISVSPTGRKLPASFLAQNWKSETRSWLFPKCLTRRQAHCKARLIDLNGDGVDEIVIVDSPRIIGFALDKSGRWTSLGTWEPQNWCGIAIPETDIDQLEATPQLPTPWPDLLAKGKRLHFSPPAPNICD